MQQVQARMLLQQSGGGDVLGNFVGEVGVAKAPEDGETPDEGTGAGKDGEEEEGADAATIAGVAVGAALVLLVAAGVYAMWRQGKGCFERDPVELETATFTSPSIAAV